MLLRALRNLRLSVRSTRVLVPVLLLLLAAQGLAQWHMLSERHAVCAAHGEIEECSDHDAVGPASASPSNAAVSLSSIDPDDGHGDEHCAVALALHQSARAASSPPASELLLDATPIPAIRVRESVAAQQPIFRLAPKQSPPIA